MTLKHYYDTVDRSRKKQTFLNSNQNPDIRALAIVQFLKSSFIKLRPTVPPHVSLF